MVKTIKSHVKTGLVLTGETKNTVRLRSRPVKGPPKEWSITSPDVELTRSYTERFRARIKHHCTMKESIDAIASFSIPLFSQTRVA